MKPHAQRRPAGMAGFTNGKTPMSPKIKKKSREDTAGPWLQSLHKVAVKTLPSFPQPTPRPAKVSQADPGVSTFQRYCSEVQKIPCLSAQEERTVAYQAEQGSAWAREKMIVSNLRLVMKAAYPWVRSGLPLMDLIAEGNLGLIHAVKKFNPALGYRFSTYALWWIKHAIDRAVLNQSRLVRWPVHVSKENRTLFKDVSGQANGDEKKEEEGLSPRARHIQSSLASACVLQWPISCQRWDEEEDYALQKALVDETQNPARQWEEQDTQRHLWQAIKQLSAPHQQVVIQRFGLNGNEAQTLAGVGKEMGFSHERVRQLQSEALRLLRKKLGNHPEKSIF